MVQKEKKMRIFMDSLYVIWAVCQNPCGCHPMDVLIETKLPNGKIKATTYLGAKSQKEIEKYLKKRFILELK